MTTPDDRIVIDCPECRRVIWNGTRCTHGVVQLEPAAAPVEVGDGAVLEPGDDRPRKRARGRSGP